MQDSYFLLEKGFTSTVNFYRAKEDIRIAARVTLPKMPDMGIGYKVVRKNGVYTPILSVAGGDFEGSVATDHARATLHALTQATAFADDLGYFERNPEGFLKRLEAALAKDSRRKTQLLLPLVPLSLSSEDAQEVIRRLHNVRLFGDLTSAENVGRYDPIMQGALRDIFGRIPAVTVADDEFLVKFMNALPKKLSLV